MKRDVAISLLHNLGELLEIDVSHRTDNQVLAIAKLKLRVRDAYNARRPETLWWSRDVERHPDRRKLLNACIAYTGVDVELRRIMDARRAARLSKRLQSEGDAPGGAEGFERSAGGQPVGNQPASRDSEQIG